MPGSHSVCLQLTEQHQVSATDWMLASVPASGWMLALQQVWAQASGWQCSASL